VPKFKRGSYIPVTKHLWEQLIATHTHTQNKTGN